MTASRSRPSRGNASRGSAKQRHFRTDRDGDVSMGGGAAVRKSLPSAQSSSNAAPLTNLLITGWSGKAGDFIQFLERRANIQSSKVLKARGIDNPRTIRIPKSSTKGTNLIISIRPDDAQYFLHLNGFSYSGKNIKVEETKGRNKDTPQESASTTSPNDVKELLKGFLGRRYNAEQKLLNLNALGTDEQLNALGMFNTATTTSKFFPALMKVCDAQFQTAQEKKDTVESVTLAQNELTDLASVTSLAITFPQLKNLDLSNNKFQDLASLSRWKNKFKNLDHLILTGNPLEQNVIDYAEQIKSWYRSLRFLNGIQVRTDEDIKAQLQNVGKPLPVRTPIFQDEGGIGEAFIRNFFLGFDNDRATLANTYYDAQSKFSLAVNTHALRDNSKQNEPKPQEWGQYIKTSRNLKHLTHPGPRMARKFKGAADIAKIWSTLPQTRHPDIMTNLNKWCIECQLQPCLPDPTGQSLTGVNGLLITIHGEFEEVDPSNGQVKKHRSFDRTFTLGPGGPSGVRVVSEMWTIRAYGGFKAWQLALEGEAMAQAQVPAPVSVPVPVPVPAPVLPVPPVTGAAPATQDSIIAEVVRITNMKPEFAKACLDENGWVLETALAAFEAAKAGLPREAFL